MNIRPKAWELLDFIRLFHDACGRCPTYDEMREGMDYASNGPLVIPLNQLVAAGYIERTPGAKNGLRLPSKRRRAA